MGKSTTIHHDGGVMIDGSKLGFLQVRRKVLALLNSATQAGKGSDRAILSLLLAGDYLACLHTLVASTLKEVNTECQAIQATMASVPSADEDAGGSYPDNSVLPGSVPEMPLGSVERYQASAHQYRTELAELCVLCSDFRKEREGVLTWQGKRERSAWTLQGLSVLWATQHSTDKWEGRFCTRNHLENTLAGWIVQGDSRGHAHHGKLRSVVRYLAGKTKSGSPGVKGERVGQALAERTVKAALQEDKAPYSPGPSPIGSGITETGVARFKRIAGRFLNCPALPGGEAGQDGRPVSVLLEQYYGLQGGDSAHHFGLGSSHLQWGWKAAWTFARNLRAVPERFRGSSGKALKTWGNTFMPGGFNLNEQMGDIPIGEPVTLGEVTEAELRVHLRMPSLVLSEPVPIVGVPVLRAGRQDQGEGFLVGLGRVSSRKLQEVLGRVDLHLQGVESWQIAETQGGGNPWKGRILSHIGQALGRVATIAEQRQAVRELVVPLWIANPTIGLNDSRTVGNCLSGTLSWCRSIGLNPPPEISGVQAWREGDEFGKSWQVPARDLLRACFRTGWRNALNWNAKRVLEGVKAALIAERERVEKAEHLARIETALIEAAEAAVN